MATHDGGAVPGGSGAKATPQPSADGGAKRARAGTRTAKKATAKPAANKGAAHPRTLAIDIGGTGLKASVLDRSGAMLADRVRVPTTYPMPPSGPKGMVTILAELVHGLPEADRISAGFPGMVRHGRILSAPHFVTELGPGSPVDPKLEKVWIGFDMAKALAEAIGKPARVANDADVQGLAVMQGTGLELMITLGTGFGTAVFMDGKMLPHLEIAHQPFRKGESYNEQLGERTRKLVGDRRWKRRVRRAAKTLDEMFFVDRLYLGGGNAKRVSRDELGSLAERTTIVDNTAGILGGIKLWDEQHLAVDH